MVQLSNDGRILRELPVTIPDGCSLDNTFAPPMGETLAIEFSCSFGQAVVWLDTTNGQMSQPVTDSDSHFLAWAPDGQSAYLKVATMSLPHIVRAPLSGKPEQVPIAELTYDVSPKPGTNDEFLFSFSRGMGLGSEMWLAKSGGQQVTQLIADPLNYLSFARWSPDGSKIAFIKIPDTATPFTVGSLWVMDVDGSNPRKLADADAGHGFAEAWSPDGKRIAFVMRANPGEANADQNAAALQSNISVVEVDSGVVTALTHFPSARVEAPTWSPDGTLVAFTAMVNDKMNVYLAEVASGQVRQALSVASCCAVWTRK
jgi:Tol biopolymer transport system component